METTMEEERRRVSMAAVVLPQPHHELSMVEVLTRLPVKSVMRFKCVVSNPWCDSSQVSQDPSFVKAHRAQDPSFVFCLCAGNRSRSWICNHGVIRFYIDNNCEVEELEEEEIRTGGGGGGGGEVSNQEEETVVVVVLLPHELLMMEVLTRLPAKSLMRFKCVSNLWCSTISIDPFFAKAHRARAPAAAGLFVTYPNDDDSSSSLHCFYATSNWSPGGGGEESTVNLVPHHFTSDSSKNPCKFDGSTEVVKGLICLYAGNRSWICNVSTREIRELPSSPDLENARSFTYFLGFVSSRNEYKLFKLFSVPCDGDNRYSFRRAELLTLGKDASWRRPWSWGDTPRIELPLHQPSVYMDGSLCCWPDIPNALLVFDFEDESVQEIKPPPKATGSIYFERTSLLLQFGGHFGLVRVQHRLVNQRLEIWKLAWGNKYEQGSYEWISHFIDVPCDFPVGGYIFLGNLPLPAGDQMLMAGLVDITNNKSPLPVYSYDHAKGKFEKFLIGRFPSWSPSPLLGSIFPRDFHKFHVYYYEEDITPLHDLVISNKDSSLTAASCTKKKKNKKKKNKNKRKEQQDHYTE